MRQRERETALHSIEINEAFAETEKQRQRQRHRE